VIEPAEAETLAQLLAQHFVTYYGAPSAEAALPTAQEEIAQMAALCEDHEPNSLLTVARELSEAGVREAYRVIERQDAALDQFAIHGSLDEGPD